MPRINPKDQARATAEFMSLLCDLNECLQNQRHMLPESMQNDAEMVACYIAIECGA